MTTKELLALKRGMLVFLKQMPISLGTIDTIAQYAESITTVNTFMLGAMLMDKELNRLDRDDKDAEDILSKEFDDIMTDVENYLLKTIDDGGDQT